MCREGQLATLLETGEATGVQRIAMTARYLHHYNRALCTKVKIKHLTVHGTLVNVLCKCRQGGSYFNDFIKIHHCRQVE